MGFFCFASFYIKSFFGAILKSPKWQEIALNISESSKRRTPDPPSLFIAYTMQSSCLLEHKSGRMASGLCPQLTLHMYLQYQEEGPAWGTNGEEIPSQDPFSSQSSSCHCRVMQEVSHCDSMAHLTSSPFLTCLRAHLFTLLTLHLLLPLSEHQPTV